MVAYVVFPTLYEVKAQLIVNVVIVFITVVVVALRIASRLVTRVGLGWDDWLIIAAVPQGIGMLIISGMYSQLGVGYEATDTLANLPIILELLVAYELIYSTCISTIKMSVLFFYLRVFVNRGLRLAVIGVMVFVGLWTAGNILQVFLICTPFASTYDPTVPGKCGNRVASFIAIGAFNVITDVIILSLPIKTIWSLKMKTSTKIGLTFVFLIGLCVSVVAIVRIVSLVALDLMNLTYTMIYADFWSCLEPNLGILCASLPMLGALYSRLIKKPQSTANSHEPSSYASNSKKFNRLPDPNEEFGLQSIYAPNKDFRYNVNVKSEGLDNGSTGGSETALQAEPAPEPAVAPNIVVQKHWTVSHN